MRLVERLPPGKPVTPKIAAMERDLRARIAADNLRWAEWKQILQAQGR